MLYQLAPYEVVKISLCFSHIFLIIVLLSLFYIYKNSSIVNKIYYYTMNITLIKTEIFTIKYSLNHTLYNLDIN